MTSEDSSSSSGDSEVEWEDVEPLQQAMDIEGPSNHRSPEVPNSSASVEIVLRSDGSRVKGKRRSKQNFLDKAVAAFNRDLRHNLHKVHLLCLLTHGLHLSNQCDNPLLRSVVLSLLPREFLGMGTINEDSLLRLLKWFVTESANIFECVRISCLHDNNKVQNLTSVQLLVSLLRVIGLRARLVLVLGPIPFKLRGGEGVGTGKIRAKAGKDDIIVLSSPEVEDRLAPEGSEEGESVFGERTTEPSRKGSKGRKSKAAGGVTPSGKRKRSSGDVTPTVSDADCSMTTSSHDSRTGKPKDLSASQLPPDEEDSVINSGVPVVRRGAGLGERQPACHTSPYFRRSKRIASCKQTILKDSESENDNSYVPEVETKGPKVTLDQETKAEKMKRRGSQKPPQAKKIKLAAEKHKERGGRRQVRDREEEGVDKPDTGAEATEVKSSPLEEVGILKSKDEDVLYDETTSWAEVYLESAKQWTCLHLPSSSVGQPQLCEKHCLRNLCYAIGIENAHTVRDITARYASGWCTHTRKHRLSGDWWSEVLQPYSPDKTECEQEEEDILTLLYSHPLPTTVSNYKNHPLYALRRHLLKFEAIYPEESQPVGHCRGEPVYSRVCVHVLHTRETWLKEGRVVKKGENPYKIVKARKKKGQSVLEADNSKVEVFGRWQTEEYVPPPVVDGKVPRNEYGNIELFQPSMLPSGATHIRIPGIQRVARKLGIDYAPAMMGWDFHGGYCHPVLDGVVVAKESEGILLEAWEQEEQITMEKQIKKREQRVLERWRKLTRGVLIRERVQRRFKLSEDA